jgi:hypothetical protein
MRSLATRSERTCLGDYAAFPAPESRRTPAPMSSASGFPGIRITPYGWLSKVGNDICQRFMDFLSYRKQTRDCSPRRESKREIDLTTKQKYCQILLLKSWMIHGPTRSQGQSSRRLAKSFMPVPLLIPLHLPRTHPAQTLPAPMVRVPGPAPRSQAECRPASPRSLP